MTINENKKIEVVELLGKTALFADERIALSEIPDGLYRYELREDDDILYCTIEAHVRVDFSGTILIAEPIDLGEKGYIAFSDIPEDEQLDFLGYEMTVNEYRKAVGITDEAQISFIRYKNIDINVAGYMDENEIRATVDDMIKNHQDIIFKEITFTVLDKEYVDAKFTYESVPFERIRRITGYLVGMLDRFNDAKLAEVRDRVRHSITE